jgi:hypothetical protein
VVAAVATQWFGAQDLQSIRRGGSTLADLRRARSMCRKPAGGPRPRTDPDFLPRVSSFLFCPVSSAVTSTTSGWPAAIEQELARAQTCSDGSTRACSARPALPARGDYQGRRLRVCSSTQPAQWCIEPSNWPTLPPLTPHARCRHGHLGLARPLGARAPSAAGTLRYRTPEQASAGECGCQMTSARRIHSCAESSVSQFPAAQSNKFCEHAAR